MNALWNAPISDRFSSLCARVFSPAAAILESEKTLGTRLTQGGLTTAFDLAAFRLSMIALVKKSVSHSRTIASMRETGWEKQQEALDNVK